MAVVLPAAVAALAQLTVKVVEGATVGDLMDLTWMDEGGDRQAGALLILDRTGQLFEYDPAWEQVGYQTLGGTDTWRSPTSLRTFDANLYVLDPSTLEVTRQTTVTDQGAEVRRLNELEYIDGDLFANVLGLGRIARIDLDDGQTVGWIDLEGLAAPYGGNVMNGIAYDRHGHRLFVTGKYWDTVYEIALTFDDPAE